MKSVVRSESGRPLAPPSQRRRSCKQAHIGGHSTTACECRTRIGAPPGRPAGLKYIDLLGSAAGAGGTWRSSGGSGKWWTPRSAPCGTRDPWRGIGSRWGRRADANGRIRKTGGGPGGADRRVASLPAPSAGDRRPRCRRVGKPPSGPGPGSGRRRSGAGRSLSGGSQADGQPGRSLPRVRPRAFGAVVETTGAGARRRRGSGPDGCFRDGRGHLSGRRCRTGRQGAGVVRLLPYRLRRR